MAKGKVGKTVESLGDYLKEQRVASRLSLRQLAEQAGVSNPYLSQIERGLRKPSADVLQQIAKALRISAEQLYIRAGIVSPEDGVGGSVELAVLADTGLTERQKQSLLDVYSSFLALNAAARASDPGTTRPDHHPGPSGPGRTNPEGVNMAKAKFDIKTEATRPLLRRRRRDRPGRRGRVRGYVADVQKKFAGVQKDVQKSVNDLDFEPKALREQAVTVVNSRVDALSKDAKARRTAIEARVAELQAEAKAYPAKVQALLNDNVAETYDELVKRGETLVGRIRRQESTKAHRVLGEDHHRQGQDDHHAGQEDGCEDVVHRQEDRRQEVPGQEQRQGDRHRREEDRCRRGRRRHRRRGEGRRLKRPGAADAVLT